MGLVFFLSPSHPRCACVCGVPTRADTCVQVLEYNAEKQDWREILEPTAQPAEMLETTETFKVSQPQRTQSSHPFPSTPARRFISAARP